MAAPPNYLGMDDGFRAAAPWRPSNQRDPLGLPRVFINPTMFDRQIDAQIDKATNFGSAGPGELDLIPYFVEQVRKWKPSPSRPVLELDREAAVIAELLSRGALIPPSRPGLQGEDADIPAWFTKQDNKRNEQANRAVLESILMPRPAGPGMGTFQRQRPRPVYDERGNVKGFDTRALGQRDVMKYLWPTETIRPGERPPAPTGR